jgi:hypothetical protein
MFDETVVEDYLGQRVTYNTFTATITSSPRKCNGCEYGKREEKL